MRARKESRLDAEGRGLLAYQAALDRKANDIVILDLRKISTITDLFLLCTGQNARQMQAIAEAIDERLSECGVEPLSREGTGEGTWILLDYDDLVVHVFSEEARKFYNLERLWARARRLTNLAGETIVDRTEKTRLNPATSRTGSAQ
ncbi:MAG: ribosome silencing factor [Nitrospinota bacterium]